MRDTIYSNAIASSYEGKLLSADRINRLVECQDEHELLRLISESNFGMGASSVDEAISNEYKALGEFVRDYSPSLDISTYMLVKYDYLYLEQLLKEKYLSTKFSTPIHEGLYPKKTLKSAVENGDYSTLPPLIVETISEAESKFENNPKGYEISALFSNALYRHLLTIRTTYLKNAVNYEITLKNIMVALRSRNAHTNDMYIDGGDIPIDTLRLLENGIDDSIVHDYTGTIYHDIFASALKCYDNSLPFVEIERMIDSYLLSMLRQDRLLLGGAKPYMLYCLYKQNEIKNIRIILTGVRTNQDKSTIKARLREGYEG